MSMAPWRREAGFLALCFAAATAVSFLPDTAQEVFADRSFGAPPLLALALATVTGTGALWLLRVEGFFPAEQSAHGVGWAALWATLLTAPMIVVSFIAPGLHPPPPEITWPAALPFHAAAMVVTMALTGLAPLTLAYILVRRAWPALVLAALTAMLLDALVSGMPSAVLAAQTFTMALAGLWLLKRYGLAALIVFSALQSLYWDLLWGAARATLTTIA